MSRPKLFLLFLLLCILIQSAFSIPVRSQTSSLGFITIKPDGSVEPSSASIQRVGDVFVFSGNIYDPIILERGNIVLNGAGYCLQGNGTGTPLILNSAKTDFVGRDNGIGINITCSNTTVTNIYVDNWLTGIDGAYDNNTITGNSITHCKSGIKIYGNNYVITGNYVGTNDMGMHIAGIQTLVTRNT